MFCTQTLTTVVLVIGFTAFPITAVADEIVKDSATTSAESETPADETPVDESTFGRMPTEQAIAKFQQRVKDHPGDYASYTILGQLHLRQAKEEDDLPSYAKAEESFREALKINPEHFSAMTWLAITLEARHEFAEALELASRVAATSERETLALAAVGDCQLHLGRYDEAAGTYQTLAERANSPAVIARLAHLSELNGQPDQAIAQIRDALKLSRTLGGTGQELAWYEMRLGHLMMNQGQLADAETHFRQALKISKDYAAAQLGLAEVCALQGRLDESEKLYLATIDQHGEPPAMAGLGDVMKKKGDSESAEAWYAKADAVMAEEALTAAAAHYREVAMFYANHELKPTRALELAEMDLKQRQDIQAYDCLAWTLYRNQQFDKALEAIESALRLNTRDASMHFHAGMIHLALGDTQKAKASLSKVMEINPNFSVLYSDVAAAELKKLQ